MYTGYLLLNKLKKVDITFFLICLGIIVAIIAIYFLIPVFNKSQYEERRNNLRQREAAFKNGRTAYNANGTMISAPEEAETEDDRTETETEETLSPVNEAAQIMPVSETTERTEE